MIFRDAYFPLVLQHWRLYNFLFSLPIVQSNFMACRASPGRYEATADPGGELYSHWQVERSSAAREVWKMLGTCWINRKQLQWLKQKKNLRKSIQKGAGDFFSSRVSSSDSPFLMSGSFSIPLYVVLSKTICSCRGARRVDLLKIHGSTFRWAVPSRSPTSRPVVPSSRAEIIPDPNHSLGWIMIDDRWYSEKSRGNIDIVI